MVHIKAAIEHAKSGRQNKGAASIEQVHIRKLLVDVHGVVKELLRRGTYFHGGIHTSNRPIVEKRYITKNMITIVPQPESVLIWYKKISIEST